MDDLQPSEWFKERCAEWTKTMKDWESKCKAFNASKPKKAKKVDDDDEEPNDEVDTKTVTDVCNIGDGEPLFANFQFDDWAMFQLRWEVYLLQQAYKHDVANPDRIGIHESN